MDGIINVLKPPGLTSRQVVSVIKGITKEKKVGHGGTLDPGACGVLPVMLGKATRLFDYICDGSKEYTAEFMLGTATTTQDAYGEIVKSEKVHIERAEFEKALQSFVGEYEQVPSAFSAVHIGGKRAYEYAFKGESVELPKRKVTIYNAELLAQTGERSFLVRVECSKGCYIRSLCEDVAKRLGTLGYVSVLIRTRLGRLDIENAFTIDELQDFKEEYITPIEEFLDGFDALYVPNQFDSFLHNGNKLPVSLFDGVCGGKTYKIYDSKKVLYALGTKDGDIIRIKQMLR